MAPVRLRNRAFFHAGLFIAFHIDYDGGHVVEAACLNRLIYQDVCAKLRVATTHKHAFG